MLNKSHPQSLVICFCWPMSLQTLVTVQMPQCADWKGELFDVSKHLTDTDLGIISKNEGHGVLQQMVRRPQSPDLIIMEVVLGSAETETRQLQVSKWTMSIFAKWLQESVIESLIFLLLQNRLLLLLSTSIRLHLRQPENASKRFLKSFLNVSHST